MPMMSKDILFTFQVSHCMNRSRPAQRPPKLECARVRKFYLLEIQVCLIKSQRVEEKIQMERRARAFSNRQKLPSAYSLSENVSNSALWLYIGFQASLQFPPISHRLPSSTATNSLNRRKRSHTYDQVFLPKSHESRPKSVQILPTYFSLFSKLFTHSIATQWQGSLQTIALKVLEI